MSDMRGAAGDGDHGGALILVLVLTGLLSALGAGLITLVSTERTIAGNVQFGTNVQYAADAMAERAIADLAQRADWTPVLSGVDRSSFVSASLAPVTSWRVRLDLLQLTADLQRQPTLGGASGANAPIWRLFAWGAMDDLIGGSGRDSQAYLVAWVADDEADQDSDPSADTNGCVQVQVEARGFGGLRKSVRLVLKRSESHSSVTEGGTATGGTADGGDTGDLARDLPEDTGALGPEVRPPGGLRLLSWRDDER